MFRSLTRDQMAQVVAQDIPTGSYVNLGIGMPTLVADYLMPEQHVTLHSENGLLGMRALESDEPVDPDLLNATKEPVALNPGASVTDHVISFAMMRGGHIDLSVLGAFQISEAGDIANWDTGQDGAIPGVGGAMDLVVGARKVYVMMTHEDRESRSKFVRVCDYPLTGCGVVSRVYSDLAVLERTATGWLVLAAVPGLTMAQLQERTGFPIGVTGKIRILDFSG